MAKEIGKVENISYEIKHFKWTILDFFTIVQDKTCKYYDCPNFPFADTSWHLRLYPNWNNSYEFTELELYKQMKREYLVEYNFGFKKCDGSIEYLLSGILKGNKMSNDVVKFVKKSELLLRQPELVPGNVLTIVGTLKLMSEMTNSSEQTALDAPRHLTLISK